MLPGYHPSTGARACFVVLAADAEGKRKLIGGDAFAARLLGPLPSTGEEMPAARGPFFPAGGEAYPEGAGAVPPHPAGGAVHPEGGGTGTCRLGPAARAAARRAAAQALQPVLQPPVTDSADGAAAAVNMDAAGEENLACELRLVDVRNGSQFVGRCM